MANQIFFELNALDIVRLSSLDKEIGEIFHELHEKIVENSPIISERPTIIPAVILDENEPLLIILFGNVELLYRKGEISGILESKERREQLYAYCREKGVQLNFVNEQGLVRI